MIAKKSVFKKVTHEDKSGIRLDGDRIHSKALLHTGNALIRSASVGFIKRGMLREVNCLLPVANF
jgi:hypothetical protein